MTVETAVASLFANLTGWESNGAVVAVIITFVGVIGRGAVQLLALLRKLFLGKALGLFSNSYECQHRTQL